MAYTKVRDIRDTCTYMYSLNAEGDEIFVSLYVYKSIILTFSEYKAIRLGGCGMDSSSSKYGS